MRCNGGCDGGISIEGDDKGLIYIWNGSDTTELLDSLCAGSYSLEVVDTLTRCRYDTVLVVEEPPRIEITFDRRDESCGGCNDGSARANATGGRPPYRYSWNTGDTTQGIADLAPGVYSVTVSDSEGCTAVAEVRIRPADCLRLIDGVEVEDARCHRSCDGRIRLHLLGGGDGLRLLWSTGDTTTHLENLCAGDYSVTITNVALGCSIDTTFVITEPPSLDVHLRYTDESCNQCNDGTASIEVMGGNPPYRFLWSTGDSVKMLRGLSPGLYSITITDANECKEVLTFTVGRYKCPEVSIFATVSDTICHGSCEGEIRIDSVVGGTPPYTYHWIQGDTTPEVTGLCAGYYVVNIIDAKRCRTGETFVIASTEELHLGYKIVDVSCAQCTDGSIELTVEGGRPPYTYTWSTGDTTRALGGLSSGEYYVTVTDANGCRKLDTVEIRVKCPRFNAQIHSRNVSCKGVCDGWIKVFPPDTGVYYYEWSTGDTAAQIEGLCAGVYKLSVTDVEKGCRQLYTVVIEAEQVLEIEVVRINHAVDSGFGAIDIEVSGGSPPYTYQWSTQEGVLISHSEDVDSLKPGCYLLQVADAFGCRLDTMFCIRDKSIGTTDIVPTSLRIYPNPLYWRQFFVEVKPRRDLPLESMLLYDVYGQRIAVRRVERVREGLWRVILADDTPRGMYLLRIPPLGVHRRLLVLR